MRLTEANYASRKLKLQQHIKVAEDAVAEAAFRAELGEGTEADIKTARGNVDTLKDRLNGLDLAWKRTLETEEADAKAKRMKARKASHDVAIKALDGRTEAAGKMALAIVQLSVAYRDYRQAGQAVLNEAVKHRDLFKLQRIADLKEDIQSPFTSIEASIVGQLRAWGLDLVGVRPYGNMSSGQDRHSHVPSQARFANERTAASLEILLDEADGSTGEDEE